MSSNLQQPLSSPQQPSPPALSEGMVQIDAGTLSSLLSLRADFTTFECKLSKDVKKLQEELSTVSSELTILQKNTSAFRKFSDLPDEIQVMIWKFAMTSVPQIHIIGQDFCSTSNINDVAISCKKANDEFKKLTLDFLTIGSYHAYYMVNYRNYVNFGIDTFWFINKQTHKPYSHIPGTVLPQCGKCVRESKSVTPRNYTWSFAPNFPNCVCDKQFGPKFQGRFEDWYFRTWFPIRTLAININSWINTRTGFGSDESIELLFRCKVEELLIVVGDTPFPSTDTVFLAPRSECAASFNGKILNVRAPLDHDGCCLYGALEDGIVKAMHELKAGWIIEDKEEREDMETYAEEDEEYWKIRSEWKIPTVKFVQAKPVKGQWVVPLHRFD